MKLHLSLATGAPSLIARTDIPRSRGVAVVDFRTHCAGSYKWLRSPLVRGHYRVLELRDVDGPRCVHSHNVISVLYQGPEGIDGTGPRSKYYLGDSEAQARAVADRYNNATGECNEHRNSRP